MNPALKYTPTIGLEVHVQLSTRSKIFCGCSTKFGAEPNSHTCPVCLGLPGVLPVLNRAALDSAIKVALALGCKIQEMMKFDRKSYFYPDLPKNFQISQFDLPLGSGGKLEFLVNDRKKKVKITRVHLEEDAGKLMHTGGGNKSLVDFNRTGTPLLEIVSEPDITSSEEAYEYLAELKSILKYLDVSDCNMEEGSLRCDANISVKLKSAGELGDKVELKNMNSFKGVKNALDYEIARQTVALEDGDKVAHETRLWNEAKQETRSMRSKEEAFDYRYFPEPDLAPFTIASKDVKKIKEGLPELPNKRLARFVTEYSLTQGAAYAIVKEKDVADYFEETAGVYKGDPKFIANWITGDIASEMNKRYACIRGLGIPPARLAELIQLIDEGAISGKIAKGILLDMIETRKPPRSIVESKGLLQIKDESELTGVVDGVIKANTGPVEEYRKGKKGVLGFLVGQVMKATGGKANPKIANKLLTERINKT